MPITTDFETQLRGPWDTASGFLVEQLSLMQAQIAPIYPLITGIQSTANAAAGNPIIGITGYPANAVMITDATSAPSFSSALPMPFAFMPSLILSPPALAADTHNYSPTGVASAAAIRLAATAAINLTGLVAPVVPHLKLLTNVGSATITIKHQSTLSLSGNRFQCAGAADVALTTGSGLWIWYDSSTSAKMWQVLAVQGAAAQSASWTPTLASAGGSGLTATTSGTSSRVGGLCYIDFACTVTALGSASSYVVLGGLPIPSASTNNTYLPMAWSAMTTALGGLMWEIGAGATQGYLRFNPAGGATDSLNTALTVGNITASTVFRGSGVYRVQ